MPRIVFYITVTLIYGQGQRSGSRSKVGAKVTGRGQGQGQRLGSRSKVEVKSNFWRAAVDSMGSALPSAAKSNNHHYQSKVIVCVSVISRRRRIIAHMQSIGF